MPRQVRIQFEGARYHVLARGNRRADIFYDDRDRERFLETLDEACGKTGWRIHAYVLMGNHYHLLIETPQANLVAGMSWLQSTYTVRFNVRHRLSGHLFGGRYKAILVEAQQGDYFRTLLDYIHLNPVRAGIVRKGQGIASYAWSSLSYYRRPPSKRKDWQVAGDGLARWELKDTARGRQKFVERLEERVRTEKAREAGLAEIEGQSLQSTLRRGWYFGSRAFGEELLGKVGALLSGRNARRADGYHGEDLREHDEGEARRIIAAGLEEFALTGKMLASLRKNDWRKALIAHVVKENTTVSLDWISERLTMGARSAVSRNAKQAGLRAKRERKAKAAKKAIERRARINDPDLGR